MEMMLIFFTILVAVAVVAVLTYIRPKRPVRHRPTPVVRRTWHFDPPESDAAPNQPGHPTGK
jgi:hypothetical protein